MSFKPIRANKALISMVKIDAFILHLMYLFKNELMLYFYIIYLFSLNFKKNKLKLTDILNTNLYIVNKLFFFLILNLLESIRYLKK